MVGSRWRDTPIAYGPIVAVLCGAIGHIQSLWCAMLTWKAVILGANLAAVVIGYLFCRHHFDPERGARSFILFAFSPVLVWEISGQAHNDGVLVLALIGFVCTALRGREWYAIVCLAVAVFSKFSATAVLILYLVFVFRRNRGRAILMLLLVSALGAVLAAPYWRSISSIRGPIDTLGGHATRTSRSFADLAVWGPWSFSEDVQNIVYRIFWLGGMGSLAWLGVRAVAHVRTANDVIHHGLVILGAYCVVAAPWFQPWYVTWLLPLALVDNDAHWQNLTALYSSLTPIQYVLSADPLTTIAINIIVLRKLISMRHAERCA